MDIHEVYDQLYKENIKLHKVNRLVFKKLNELELEKERLIGKLEESTRGLDELSVEKEFLEVNVKTLMSDLGKSNIQLQSFSS